MLPTSLYSGKCTKTGAQLQLSPKKSAALPLHLHLEYYKMMAMPTQSFCLFYCSQTIVCFSNLVKLIALVEFESNNGAATIQPSSTLWSNEEETCTVLCCVVFSQ